MRFPVTAVREWSNIRSLSVADMRLGMAKRRYDYWMWLHHGVFDDVVYRSTTSGLLDYWSTRHSRWRRSAWQYIAIVLAATHYGQNSDFVPLCGVECGMAAQLDNEHEM